MFPGTADEPLFQVNRQFLLLICFPHDSLSSNDAQENAQFARSVREVGPVAFSGLGCRYRISKSRACSLLIVEIYPVDTLIYILTWSPCL